MTIKYNMNKAFTKSDLKDGMICTTRNGKTYVVKGDRLVRDNGFYILTMHLADDLTMREYDIESLDIISVQQTITVFQREDKKQLAIKKELEFAKAKAERLHAHIAVLESKLYIVRCLSI